MAVDYPACFQYLAPGREWSMKGNDPATAVVLDGGGALPTKTECDTVWPTVEAQRLADEKEARVEAELFSERDLDGKVGLLELLVAICRSIPDTDRKPKVNRFLQNVQEKRAR